MQKIKKIFLYSLGGFLAFVFSRGGVFAQWGQADLGSEYGVFMGEPFIETTIWDKIIYFIFSPLFISVIIVLILVFGIFIYIKRKRKDVKKNS